MGKIVIFLSCIILLGGGCENPIVLKKDLVAFEDRLNKSESTKLLDLDERCSENAQKFIITKKYELWCDLPKLDVMECIPSNSVCTAASLVT